MKLFRWAVKEDCDLPSTNRVGEVPVHDSGVGGENVTRSCTPHQSSDGMMLAHALVLKCVVTAIILSLLGYYFIVRVESLSAILYP